jgi:hypothetical protein
MLNAEALETTESSLQKPSQKATNCLNKRSMQGSSQCQYAPPGSNVSSGFSPESALSH